MAIAAATVDDADALRAVHVATWTSAYRTYAAERWYVERMVAHRARDWASVVRDQAAKGGGVLAARAGDTIVGLCQYGPAADEDCDPARAGEIHRLFVHPGWQSKGFGRLLLNAGVERLRDADATLATLWVLESDQRARSFYAHLGWKPDGSRITHPPTDLRYTLPLA